MAGRRATKRKEASDAVEQDEVDVRAVERSPSISSGTDESDSEDTELAIDSGSDGDDRSEDTRQSVGAEEEDEDDVPKRRWAAVMDDDEEDDEEDSEEDDEGSEEVEFGSESEDEDEVVGSEEEDLASDSSEEEREHVNTIGEGIPLKWYEHERHIGYDVEGKRIQKQAGENKASTVDFFLDKQDGTLGSKSNKVWDEYNQRVVELTKEEMLSLIHI